MEYQFGTESNILITFSVYDSASFITFIS